MGSVIGLHGVLYAREYGYDNTFEAYVASGLAEFALSYDPGQSRLWVLEREDEIVGSIAIVRRTPQEAQLRWFLLHPHIRHLGLGRILIEKALQFCREKGYTRVFLWTLKHLSIATHLYSSRGFCRTEEKCHLLWGKTITEERYDLILDP
jgi:N-acetylglutamate synthase-like GNAT family acetyltransferase